MDKLFSEVVESIITKVKSTRGGMKKLIEVTGKTSGLISQWRSGKYVPSLDVQIKFIESANTLIKEMAEEKKEKEKQIKELSDLLLT